MPEQIAEQANVENNVPGPLTPLTVDNIPADWAQKFPAEMRELEQLRTKRLEMEAKAAESKAALLELEQQNAALHQKAAIKDAFRESGVKFHPSQSEVIKLLGADIDFDGDNVPSVDGRALSDVLKEFALANETLADGRSLRSLREKTEDKTPKSKADFRGDVKAINSFINEKGLAAWSSLPARPPVTLSGTPDREQWRHMSAGQKSAVIGRHGSGIVARILKGEFDR